jgi:alpha-1,6-mannosyltransferase
VRDARRPHWADARPWQANAALILIGCGMVGFTRQLISEYSHYTIGFSGVSSSMLVLYLGAVLIFLIQPSNVNRYTFWIIVAFAIACRLVALLPAPYLSTDVYRYVWDGVVQHARINPYRYVPGDARLTFLRAPNQNIYDHINRRDYARTIYPPVAQMLFFIISFISPTVTFMKTAMVLFEGLTMFGLVKLLREIGMQREWTLLYAWCPMLVWEFAGSGHMDSMVMAFMVFALLYRYRRQPVLTGLFLGLAVLTKFYPLVLFPALYRRGDWKMPTTMAGLAILFYAPYLSAGKMVFGFLGGYVDEEGMASGSRYFLLELAQHLPGLHGVSNWAYIGFVAAMFGALMVWAWRTGCRADSSRDAFLWPAFGLALALMLLFSPHYPWYVAWLVPFLVLLPNLTVMTYVCGLFYLCTTALAAGYGPKQYALNEILYSAVAIAFMIEMVGRRVPLVRDWMNGLARRPVEVREHSLSG